MDSVIRAAVIYFLLLLLFRITGKRSLGQVTTFDFVLLLIIGEAVQNSLLGNDYSITNGVIAVTTLVLLDIRVSLLKQRSQIVATWVEGTPLIIVDNGNPLKQRMKKARVDEEDVMEAARSLRGLERLDQIRWAVLERNGEISIVPKRE
jgi:uncharacterized membrane protein YcaP (DUF421 family)